MGKGESKIDWKVVLCPEKLKQPLHWRAPRTIFVNSRSDLFHPKVPFDFAHKVLAVSLMAPQHTFIIVTKRPARMAECVLSVERLAATDAIPGWRNDPGMWLVRRHGPGLFPADAYGFYPWPPPNVWLVATCCTRAEFVRNVPHLVKCPAVVHGVSLEPLLEEMDCLYPWCSVCGSDPFVYGGGECMHGVKWQPQVDWVIVGGESGARDKVRPCNLAWIRSLRDQCGAAGVAFYLKQLGSSPTICDGIHPNVQISVRRILDLHSPKGSDPSEWPPDLQPCRAWPEVTQ